MIEIKQLSVEGKNHTKLLHNISFSINPGQCIGLTGASGAGKTTLIKSIMGILDSTCNITKGDIMLDGLSIPSMNPTQRRNLCGTTLGFIPQNPMTAFDRQIKIGKQMVETFRLRLGCSRSDAVCLAEETLQIVNLTDVKRVMHSYTSQLSGGMLQRITMAILWALKPRYILADEPTSALDEANRDLLLQLLQSYPVDSGILFLSHDTTALKILCKEIIVLERGQLVERAITNELFSNPSSPWTKQFVAASKNQEEGVWEWMAS